MKMNDSWTLLPPRGEMERAFAAKDASYDGVFYVAVKTTGIFCRPSCPSKPKLENVEFFPSVSACLFAGYRPCKRCHPLHATGTPPDWVDTLISRVGGGLDARDESIHPVRRGAGGMEGMTTLARAVSGKQAGADRGKKLNVLQLRLGRTGWAAKDAGGFDGDIKHAVVAGVFGGKRSLHFTPWGQQGP